MRMIPVEALPVMGGDWEVVSEGITLVDTEEDVVPTLSGRDVEAVIMQVGGELGEVVEQQIDRIARLHAQHRRRVEAVV